MMKLLALAIGIMLAGWTASALAQSPPCDPTFAVCPVSSCAVEGWGIRITVHAGDFECFKFYRKYCGDTEWTLIHEGPSNTICDCGYNPNGHQKYLVARYHDNQSGKCSTFSDDCESMWQPSACP